MKDEVFIKMLQKVNEHWMKKVSKKLIKEAGLSCSK